MTHQKDLNSDAVRDAAAALRAWMREDWAAVRHINRRPADRRDFTLALEMVCISLLSQHTDADRFIDAVLGLADNIEPPKLSLVASARNYLRRELADGKAKDREELMQGAIDEGVVPDDARGRKALCNARDQLGLVTIKTDDGLAWRLSAKDRQRALVERAERIASGQ